MKPQIWAGVGLLHATTVAGAEYIWPSKYDFLEDVMALQAGYIRMGFIDAVNPCDFGHSVVGRQNAAEWIRTAYHDMSTHDAATGTGGLDASIMFELDRDENKGTAFNNSLGFFRNYYSPRTTGADLIALSVVAASSTCGGPKIPFRAGRTDVMEAGPTGVPEPSQDIKTHTDIFAKAGFNTSDMITMVACGHTLGGVHNDNFPEITGDTTPLEVHRFESNTSHSFSKFDNVVVTEYLEGNTANLLAYGSNETTNSDKRVFSADGNETMNALADPATFQAKCADILERMINTVPSTVTLTDVMDPFEVKPYIKLLALNSDGKLVFEGRIRVRVTNRATRDFDVHLTYADNSGANVSTAITTDRPTLQLGSSTGLFRESFVWHEFSTTLDAAAGISNFNVHITPTSGSGAEVFDNGGSGFPLENAVLLQRLQSCTGDYSETTQTRPLTVTVAVKKERAGEPVTMELAHPVPQLGAMLPRYEVKTHVFEKTGVEKGDYVLFEANTPIEELDVKITYDIVVGEGAAQTRLEFQDTDALVDPCTPL